MSNKIHTAALNELVNLQTAFIQTRQQSLGLIANLSAEDCQAQSMPDASPAKWHLAHTTWFFETMVLQYFENDFAPWRKEFAVLFNSYYNAVGDKHPRPARGLLTRPTLEEVLAWRQQVDARMQKLLTDEITTELAWITELGIHHEQQHQELLLTDIHHLFSSNSLLPSFLPEQIRPTEVAGAHHWLRGPQQEHNLFKLGFNTAATGFHFDNEAPQHT
ncbi:MAG: ergothioneine biosynthesis protein EgtB, partial [Burkholderiaceae bacterium]|nr:ergothioneine biosynthesis protein EgtB [Burkholderiaceae bacterium]